MRENKPDHFAFITRFFALSQRYPKIFCALLFSLLLLAIVSLRWSKLELDIYDVYDPNFQSSLDLNDLKEIFSDRSQMLIAFSYKENPRAHDLCELTQWMHGLSHYTEIHSITSLWSVRHPKVTSDRVLYPKVLHDPCLGDPQRVVDIQKDFSGTFFRHLLAKTGSRDLVFDISFSGDESSMKQVQYVMDQTHAFISKKGNGLEARFLGLSGSRYYFKKIMFSDSIYNLLVLVIILLLMRVLFGTWISGLYLSFTLIAANIFLYGLMAVLGISINILTNNLFLMTAVAGTADFIFVSHYQLSGQYNDSFKKLIVPCFLTTLTTVVGFLSLNSSDLNLIRQFGNGAAIGAVSEWLMMFIMLPVLLRVCGKEKNWVHPSRAFKLRWIDKLNKLSLPRWVLFFMLFLMVAAIPSFSFLNDQDSPVKNLPKDHIMRKAYEDFVKKFSWQGQVYLYFPASVKETTYKKILNDLKTNPLIFRVEDPEELAQEWTEGLPNLKKELILRELSLTPLWERFHASGGQIRLPLYLYDQDLHSLRKLREAVEDICGKQCRLAGQRVVYLEYGEKISKTMIESFAVSILLVVLILWGLVRLSGKHMIFWPIALSSLMGPLVTMSLISLFQVPVTIITSIFLAVMVGLAGDNAIQFIMAPAESLSSGISSRARASLAVTLVMMCGSSMFLLQTLLPMKILGGLFLTGFTINYIGDLWGLKALLGKED